jgi:hypothetical protein
MSFAVTIRVAGKEVTVERHVPLAQTSFPTLIRECPDQIVAVQADGHELSFLIEWFGNLPWSKSQVNHWRGDWAQFIFENLPYLPGPMPRSLDPNS